MTYVIIVVLALFIVALALLTGICLAILLAGAETLSNQFAE